jgi:hypothetical protein
MVSLVGGVATFNSADVFSATTVTATGLALTGAQAADYVLDNPVETASMSIQPLAVTGSVTVANKFYDGTAVATVTGRSLSGVLGTDDVSLAGGTALFSSSSVGKNKTVTVTGLSLAGSEAGDYRLLNPVETAKASIQPLQISGTVYNKMSRGGIQSNVVSSDITATGPGLASRTVTLVPVGHTGAKRQTDKTDANGNFSFTNLAAGTYLLNVNLPPHWHDATFPAAGELITVQPGASTEQVLLGQSDSATVSGSVFTDANKDGKRQAREPGLAGWTVDLTANGASVPAFSLTTDANGNFTFFEVPIGSYQLTVVEAPGYAPSAKAKRVYALTLTAGKVVTSMNFGQQLGVGSKAPGRRHAA